MQTNDLLKWSPAADKILKVPFEMFMNNNNLLVDWNFYYHQKNFKHCNVCNIVQHKGTASK